MSGKRSRNKGQRGERELCDLLTDVLRRNDISSDKLTRNLEQVRSGGADIIELTPFAFEVKRVEVLAVERWWRQAVEQSQQYQIPVLAYRQNRKPWSFCISFHFLPGIDQEKSPFHYITLTEKVFLIWMLTQLEKQGS